MSEFPQSVLLFRFLMVKKPAPVSLVTLLLETWTWIKIPTLILLLVPFQILYLCSGIVYRTVTNYTSVLVLVF